MFIHLHWHSHYSLLEAIGKPKNIVREAKDYEMSSIALTDYNGLFGAIEFYNACKDAEIKPIIWVEVWYVEDITTKDKHENIGNIVLIAKDYIWYKSLLKLVSEANLHGRNNDKARIDENMLLKHLNGLLLILGSQKCHLSKMILENVDNEKITTHLQELISLVGKENVVIELIAQDEEEFPDIKKINTSLEKLASILELQIICANNFHYVDEKDQKVSEVALAIKDGNRMFDDERRKVSQQLHIMSEEEIRNTMKDNGYDALFIDQMIENTSIIADSINLEIPLGKILFPNYESPENIKTLYQEHKDGLIVD